MALAVLIDATVVRGILVPAFMRVMGRVNWWAPAWVQRADRPPRPVRGAGTVAHPGDRAGAHVEPA